MQKVILFFSVLLFSDASIAQTNHIKKVKWLIGNWQMEIENKGKITEQWEYKNDSTLKSRSYFIKPNGDSVLQETVELVYRQENVFYIPTVANQNNNQPIFFKLSSFKNNTLVFENPKHDFPQKITYQLISKYSLKASIAGIVKCVYKKEDFSFKKIRL